ncbi:MAG TPA: CdaR family protein [Dehalococcoidia bacterium]|nr:CdaR family protein [Dehalococcoidia bacterium]
MQRTGPPRWRRAATPFALALVSLLSAIALWVAVTDAENPGTIDTFKGAIEVKAVNVPEGFAVARISEPVSIKVSTAKDTFKKLTTADFQAEIDLSGERRPTSEQVVFARIVGRKDVQVVEVSPQVVTVSLEQAASKQVPVLVNRVGSLPQGFNADRFDINPPSVVVTGATSLIQLVTSAYADVNLTGLRATLQQQYPLTTRDSRGADIKGVHVEPTGADIRINVTQLEVTLALTVVPPLQGTVADGFAVVGIAPEPQALPVSGPLESLQALGTLTTEAIDVSGIRSDLTRTVRLRLPPGLQTTRDTVTVRIKVAALPGEMIFSVAPQATAVPEGMRASFQTASVNVRLRGEIPTLRGIQAGSLRATVSAAGLEEGVHVLTPLITGPEGIQVAGLDPPQVVLVLRK